MPTIHRLAPGVDWFDLLFLGQPKRIAAGVWHGPEGVAVVDPGPSSCLPRLEASLAAMGISCAAISHILLTHVHLDHAGGVGTLLRRCPDAEVVVHAKGAPHLVDPSKLLASARRLYGDEMDRLWGPVEAVPPSRLTVVEGGEVVSVAGRTVDVAYTPGHASHHVSVFDRRSGVAWVGDTAGVCVESGYVLPPTPPPDIDIEAWSSSAERIAEWNPETLFLTHFGPVAGPLVHLRTLQDNLRSMAAWAFDTLGREGTDEERRASFEHRLRLELRRHMDEHRAAAYESAAGFGLAWAGLARYWRKRAT